jgi:hypothetical protein
MESFRTVLFFPNATFPGSHCIVARSRRYLEHMTSTCLAACRWISYHLTRLCAGSSLRLLDYENKFWMRPAGKSSMAHRPKILKNISSTIQPNHALQWYSRGPWNFLYICSSPFLLDAKETDKWIHRHLGPCETVYRMGFCPLSWSLFL